MRCLREGIHVPSIRLVDATQGLLGLEFIEGKSVRQILPGADDDDEIADEEIIEDDAGGDEAEDKLVDSMQEFGVTYG